MDRLIRMAFNMLLRHGLRRFSRGKTASSRHGQAIKAAKRINRL